MNTNKEVPILEGSFMMARFKVPFVQSCRINADLTYQHILLNWPFEETGNIYLLKIELKLPTSSNLLESWHYHSL